MMPGSSDDELALSGDTSWAESPRRRGELRRVARIAASPRPRRLSPELDDSVVAQPASIMSATANTDTTANVAATGPPPVPVDAIVQALLSGGLQKQIEDAVKKQAILMAVPDTPAVAPEGVPLMVKRQMLIGAELIEKFDPGEADANVVQWLFKIDQLGEIHKWNEYERSTIMCNI